MPIECLEAIALVELRAQVRVLRLQAALLECGVEHVQQFVDLERLVDEVPRAALDRDRPLFECAVSGDDDRDDVGIALDGGVDDSGAVDSRQAEVGDDDVEREVGEPADRFLAGIRLCDLITAVGELLGDGLPQGASSSTSSRCFAGSVI